MKPRKVIITFEFETDVPASELKTKKFWDKLLMGPPPPWTLLIDQVGRPNVIKPVKAS